MKPRFTEADLDRANAEWGANCGPSALAAILDLTLDDVRPMLRGFEDKHYTNPTLMLDALARSGVEWKEGSRPTSKGGLRLWPSYGLARIQWEGPWTEPGVPMRARYRFTHWVGAKRRHSSIGIFDVNCLQNGSGWVDLLDWTEMVAPWLLKNCVPRANGKWHITHAIEVKEPTARDLRMAG